MNKPRIRPAGIGDIEDLVSVDRQCFIPQIAFDGAELLHYLTRSDAGVFLAEIDGLTVGYVVVSLSGKPAEATLVTLDVVVQHRRKRIGSELLAAGEQWLARQGATEIDLQVDTGNDGAIRFYRRHGFRPRGRISGYYPTGADAYLMRKSLQGNGI